MELYIHLCTPLPWHPLSISTEWLNRDHVSNIEMLFNGYDGSTGWIFPQRKHMKLLKVWASAFGVFCGKNGIFLACIFMRFQMRNIDIWCTVYNRKTCFHNAQKYRLIHIICSKWVSFCLTNKIHSKRVDTFFVLYFCILQPVVCSNVAQFFFEYF